MNLSKYEDWLDEECIGYFVNTVLSTQLAKKVHSIQEKFREVFGDKIFYPKNDQLHMTLMDWVTSGRDYGNLEDELYEKNYEKYQALMKDILTHYDPFELKIDTLELFPNCIIIKGTDQGQCKSIRNAFVEKVNLSALTRKPPNIIHATIMVFKEPIDLDIAQDLLDTCVISAKEQISFFRLIRETKFRMIEYQELERFYL